MLALSPVYVLHTRPFRNTSLIVELFSLQDGRIAAVANSARGPKSRYQGQLQCFTPLLASWFGKHELKTLQQIELNGMPWQLNHHALFSAFYLNELLMRVLQKEDSHADIFSLYHDTLMCLEKNNAIESVLRIFEKRLLAALGYGIPWTRESQSGFPVEMNQYYEFFPTRGFVLCEKTLGKTAFLGEHLIAIANERFDNLAVLHSAKQLMRLAFQPLLGTYVLKSRVLF